MIMNTSFNESANKSITIFTNQLDTCQKTNSLIEYIKTHLKVIEDDLDFGVLDLVKKLNDISSLVNIANLDLTVISKMLYDASNNWEKIFLIKNAYLTIFETFKTYDKHRKFLNDVSTITYPFLKEELREVNNLIKKFKNKYKYESEMSVIRNNISGHISDNVELYYNTIIKFDANETALMIVSFLEITLNLQNFLTTILLQEQLKKDTEDIIGKARFEMYDLDKKINSLK